MPVRCTQTGSHGRQACLGTYTSLQADELFWFFELLIAALKMSASYNGLGCSNPPPFLKGDNRGFIEHIAVCVEKDLYDRALARGCVCLCHHSHLVCGKPDHRPHRIDAYHILKGLDCSRVKVLAAQVP